MGLLNHWLLLHMLLLNELIFRAFLIGMCYAFSLVLGPIVRAVHAVMRAYGAKPYSHFSFEALARALPWHVMLHRSLHVVLEEVIDPVWLCLLLLLLAHCRNAVLVSCNIDKLSVVVRISGVNLVAAATGLSIGLGCTGSDQAGLVQPGDATGLLCIASFAVNAWRLVVPRFVQLFNIFHGLMVGVFYLKFIALRVIVRLLEALVILLFPAHLEEAFQLIWRLLTFRPRRVPLISALVLARRTDLLFRLVPIGDSRWRHNSRRVAFFHLAHLLAYILSKSLPIVQEVLVDFIGSGCGGDSLEAMHIGLIVVYGSPIIGILQLIV